MISPIFHKSEYTIIHDFDACVFSNPNLGIWRGFACGFGDQAKPALSAVFVVTFCAALQVSIRPRKEKPQSLGTRLPIPQAPTHWCGTRSLLRFVWEKSTSNHWHNVSRWQCGGSHYHSLLIFFLWHVTSHVTDQVSHRTVMCHPSGLISARLCWDQGYVSVSLITSMGLPHGSMGCGVIV